MLLYQVQVTVTQPVSPVQIWLGLLSPIISTVVTAVLAIIVGRIGIAQAQSNKRQEKHLVEIQTYTNGALGLSLRVAASALRRVADITDKKEDLELAAHAEAQSAAHDAMRKVVEARAAAHDAMRKAIEAQESKKTPS